MRLTALRRLASQERYPLWEPVMSRCWPVLVDQSTLAGSGCSEEGPLGAEWASCAAVAILASAATFFCCSEPGCTTPADMINVAASSALISISMTLLFGT